MFPYRLGIAPGLSRAFLVAGTVVTVVFGLQWCCHQVRDLRCTYALESLERNSRRFLEAFTGSLEREGDGDAGWNCALSEASRVAALPHGFSVVLAEMAQDPEVTTRACLVRRFPTDADAIWEHLKDPLSIPGLAVVLNRSLQLRPVPDGVRNASWTPLENPWIQEYLWPLVWVSLPNRPGKGGTNGPVRFLLLTCRPDEIEFGARWATPGNLGLAATVDPGSQPADPSRDHLALSVHAVRWFGAPRSFVVVDQGFASSRRSAGEALSAAGRTLAACIPAMGSHD